MSARATRAARSRALLIAADEVQRILVSALYGREQSCLAEAAGRKMSGPARKERREMLRTEAAAAGQLAALFALTPAGSMLAEAIADTARAGDPA